MKLVGIGQKLVEICAQFYKEKIGKNEDVEIRYHSSGAPVWHLWVRREEIDKWEEICSDWEEIGSEWEEICSEWEEMGSKWEEIGSEWDCLIV